MGEATSRMPVARTRDGHLVTADAIDTAGDSWERPLRCAECGVDVTVVHSPLGETSRRSPHFRLWPNQHHGVNCWYDVPHQIDRLRKLKLIRRNGKQWRIVLPGVLLEPAPSGNEDSRSEHPQQYAEALTALINSARIVAGIYEAFRITHEGHELASMFTARCGAVDVPWLEFFYNKRRSYFLAQRLYRYLLTGEEAPHPFAWLFTLQRKSPGGYRFTGDCHPTPFDPPPDLDVPPEHRNNLRISFGLHLEEPEFGQDYELKDTLLAFGVPTVDLSRTEQRFLNIAAPVVHRPRGSMDQPLALRTI